MGERNLFEKHNRKLVDPVASRSNQCQWINLGISSVDFIYVYVNVDSHIRLNLDFSYFNFLGVFSEKITL